MPPTKVARRRDVHGRFMKEDFSLTIFPQFLSLPPEVRLRVYAWYFKGQLLAHPIPQEIPSPTLSSRLASNLIITSTRNGLSPLHPHLSILLTNHQVHSECKYEVLKHAIVISAPFIHGPRHHLSRNVRRNGQLYHGWKQFPYNYYPIHALFTSREVRNNVRHFAIGPHSLGVFAYPDAPAPTGTGQRRLRVFLPRLESLTVWFGSRSIDGLPPSLPQMSCESSAGRREKAKGKGKRAKPKEIRAAISVKKWKGWSTTFSETSPLLGPTSSMEYNQANGAGPAYVAPHLTRAAEVVRANKWHVSDILENNKDDIREGRLRLWLEYAAPGHPLKVARMRVFVDGEKHEEDGESNGTFDAGLDAEEKGDGDESKIVASGDKTKTKDSSSENNDKRLRIEVEIVDNTATSPQAITGRALGRWAFDY